nr:NRDE family protein [Bacillus marinisedimentorum]
MCLINFAYQREGKYKLVLAANRDEFYGRPTESASFWEDHPEILAGRDLEQMGTWMGVTKSGRFAALTNYRNPAEKQAGKASRGNIVKDFLAGSDAPGDFLEALHKKKDDYQGFNIIVGTVNDLFYYSNYDPVIRKLDPGIYSLSNALLDTPWPKTVRGKAGISACTGNDAEDTMHECLFKVLGDEERANDADLPDTGVPLEWERSLSPVFIKRPEYGTRASTIMTVDSNNGIMFIERTFEEGEFKLEKRFFFTAGQEE